MSTPSIVSPETALLVVVSCSETVLVVRDNDRSRRYLYDVVDAEDVADLPDGELFLQYNGCVWQSRELAEEAEEFDSLCCAGEEA